MLLINEAEKYRSVSETSLNKNSSISHLFFQLQITQKLQDDTERRGALNLIDLAGSEKVSKTHAMGITLEEAKKNNLSLSNLWNVIYALPLIAIMFLIVIASLQGYSRIHLVAIAKRC